MTDLKSGRRFDAKDSVVRSAVGCAIGDGEYSVAKIQHLLGKGHGYVEGLALWLEEIDVVDRADDKGLRKVLITSMQEFDELSTGKGSKVYGAKIVCDDELVSLATSEQVIDEFLDALRDYIKLSKNERVKSLFEDNPDEVRASAILQAVDGGERYYYSDGDLDLFHSTVTKCMISAGWLADYPSIWFNVENTHMLRLDTIKYIMANWYWISGIYDGEVIDYFVDKYDNISLDDAPPEEKGLREMLFMKNIDTKSLKEKFELYKGRDNDNIVFKG